MKGRFPKYLELNDFYGNPDINGDGLPDRGWEIDSIMAIKPPYQMYWSWSKEPVKFIRLHKRCGHYFQNALKEIAINFDEEFIKKHQLDQCGGGYNFRLIRGSSKQLSVHSWGAAIDLAPEINWLGRKWTPDQGMMPKAIVDIFAKQGIRWGGLWNRADAMHFEATTR